MKPTSPSLLAPRLLALRGGSHVSLLTHVGAPRTQLFALRGGAYCSLTHASAPRTQFFALRGGGAHTAQHFFETGITIVDYATGALLLAAAVLALLNCALFMINKSFGTDFRMLVSFDRSPGGRPPPIQLARIRLQVGSMAMVALTLLVVADVIDTLVKPVHEYEMANLYKLGIVATIRTGLSFSLGRELKEVEEALEESQREGEANVRACGV